MFAPVIRTVKVSAESDGGDIMCCDYCEERDEKVLEVRRELKHGHISTLGE